MEKPGNIKPDDFWLCLHYVKSEVLNDIYSNFKIEKKKYK